MRLQLVAIFFLFTPGLALPVHEKRSPPDCVGERLISVSHPLSPLHSLKLESPILGWPLTDILGECDGEGTWSIGIVLRKSICYATARDIK